MDERLKALYSSHKIFNVTKGNIGWVENLDRMELILYWENPTRRDEGQPRQRMDDENNEKHAQEK